MVQSFGSGIPRSARPCAPTGTARFYDAYGEFEWLRLEARACGRLQAIIHADFLRRHVAPGCRVLDAVASRSSWSGSLLDAVLVDNQLINIPLLTLFKWDGKFLLPTEIWERVGPIRDAVLGTIEDLAPKSNSYVFTNVLTDDNDGANQYDRIRSLAHRRRSLFLSVMLDCDVEEQVRRIDTPDRIARLKGSDPEGYRWHRQHTKLFQPPDGEVEHIDTTSIGARHSAETIYDVLLSRGLCRPGT